MNRFIFLSFLLIVLTFESHAQCKAAEDLATRILGSKANDFSFVIDTTKHNTFYLEQQDSKILIKGDTPISITVGFNYYLRNYLGVDYPLRKGELRIPKTMVRVNTPVERTAKVDNRFFLNYCTYGYSLPWFSWEDWEWMIDWMALNGINMPLNITGQEAVWMEVWKQLGMSAEEIRAYFTGPAHLAWHRMANLDAWQGPLPQNWIDGQMDLQKKILKRERELGMRAVLPAFSGHVPGKIAELNPNAKIKKLDSWANFPSTYFLDPTDPFFAEIQKLFLEKQTEFYGTDHLYGADPFNEMVPPSKDPAYLGDVTGTIYSTMSNVDPEAVWVEMAWIYFTPQIWTPEAIKASMNAVPKGKIIMLDYAAEYEEMWRKSDSHHGQPFIWCYIGNFGGVNVLEGNIKDVDKKLEALFSTQTSCIGLGCTLEGFSVSTHPYEYFFERLWCDTLDPHQWIRDWSTLRRKNKEASVEVQNAWSRLIDEVYIHYASYFEGSLMAKCPTLDHIFPSMQLPYDNNNLLACCRQLLANPSETEDSRYDIVTLYTQVLGNIFTLAVDKYYYAIENKDLSRMKEIRNLSDNLFADADRLLLTNKDFLFGRWIEQARRFGLTDEEKDYYELNARTILTYWGGGSLNDYARRLWQGLVGDYYHRRWKLFFDESISRMERGENVDKQWLKIELNPKLDMITQEEIYSKEPYPSKPQGNTYKVAKDIDSRIDAYLNAIR